MKTYSLFLFFFLIANTFNAQDTIHKRNGELIVAKISELTPTEIKYKRFDFQDGPMYVELKSNIDWVKYSNGIKETFKEEVIKSRESAPVQDYYSSSMAQNNKISFRGRDYFYKNQYHNEKEIQSILLDTKNKQIMGYVTKARQAKNMQYIGFGAIPLGIAGLFAFANSQTIVPGGIQNNTGLMAVGGLCFVAAVACPIGSGIFKHNRKEYNRKAIKLFNDTY